MHFLYTRTWLAYVIIDSSSSVFYEVFLRRCRLLEFSIFFFFFFTDVTLFFFLLYKSLFFVHRFCLRFFYLSHVVQEKNCTDMRSARASVIKWYQAVLHFSGCLMGSLTRNLFFFEPVDVNRSCFIIFSLFLSFFLSFLFFFLFLFFFF